MEGTGGPASNHSDVQAEDLTDPVCSYSSVCANEQMLSLSTSIFKMSNFHWISQFDVEKSLFCSVQWWLRAENDAIKYNFGKWDCQYKNPTKRLNKLNESLCLCLWGAKGCEQMDRPERRAPNADGQNNYPPLYEKRICICHGLPDPFNWFVMAPSHGGEGTVWLTVTTVCAEASCQTFHSDDCLIMSSRSVIRHLLGWHVAINECLLGALVVCVYVGGFESVLHRKYRALCTWHLGRIKWEIFSFLNVSVTCWHTHRVPYGCRGWQLVIISFN